MVVAYLDCINTQTRKRPIKLDSFSYTSFILNLILGPNRQTAAGHPPLSTSWLHVFPPPISRVSLIHFPKTKKKAFDVVKSCETLGIGPCPASRRKEEEEKDDAVDNYTVLDCALTRPDALHSGEKDARWSDWTCPATILRVPLVNRSKRGKQPRKEEKCCYRQRTEGRKTSPALITTDSWSSHRYINGERYRCWTNGQ